MFTTKNLGRIHSLPLHTNPLSEIIDIVMQENQLQLNLLQQIASKTQIRTEITIIVQHQCQVHIIRAMIVQKIQEKFQKSHDIHKLHQQLAEDDPLISIISYQDLMYYDNFNKILPLNNHLIKHQITNPLSDNALKIPQLTILNPIEFDIILQKVIDFVLENPKIKEEISYNTYNSLDNENSKALFRKKCKESISQYYKQNLTINHFDQFDSNEQILSHIIQYLEKELDHSNNIAINEASAWRTAINLLEDAWKIHNSNSNNNTTPHTTNANTEKSPHLTPARTIYALLPNKYDPQISLLCQKLYELANATIILHGFDYNPHSASNTDTSKNHIDNHSKNHLRYNSEFLQSFGYQSMFHSFFNNLQITSPISHIKLNTETQKDKFAHIFAQFIEDKIPLYSLENTPIFYNCIPNNISIITTDSKNYINDNIENIISYTKKVAAAGANSIKIISTSQDEKKLIISRIAGIKYFCDKRQYHFSEPNTITSICDIHDPSFRDFTLISTDTTTTPEQFPEISLLLAILDYANNDKFSPKNLLTLLQHPYHTLNNEENRQILWKFITTQLLNKNLPNLEDYIISFSVDLYVDEKNLESEFLNNPYSQFIKLITELENFRQKMQNCTMQFSQRFSEHVRITKLFIPDQQKEIDLIIDKIDLNFKNNKNRKLQKKHEYLHNNVTKERYNELLFVALENLIFQQFKITDPKKTTINSISPTISSIDAIQNCNIYRSTIQSASTQKYLILVSPEEALYYPTSHTILTGLYETVFPRKSKNNLLFNKFTIEKSHLIQSNAINYAEDLMLFSQILTLDNLTLINPQNYTTHDCSSHSKLKRVSHFSILLQALITKLIKIHTRNHQDNSKYNLINYTQTNSDNTTLITSSIPITTTDNTTLIKASPPIKHRAKYLTPTTIQKLITNPYMYYCQYILKLYPIPNLHDSKLTIIYRKEFSIIIHQSILDSAEILDTLVSNDQSKNNHNSKKQYGTYFAETCLNTLDRILPQRLSTHLQHFWQPLFTNIGLWIYNHERIFREAYEIVAIKRMAKLQCYIKLESSEKDPTEKNQEVELKLEIACDRIDIFKKSTGKFDLIITNYKIGNTAIPSKKTIASEDSSKITLEALAAAACFNSDNGTIKDCGTLIIKNLRNPDHTITPVTNIEDTDNINDEVMVRVIKITGRQNIGEDVCTTINLEKARRFIEKLYYDYYVLGNPYVNSGEFLFSPEYRDVTF